MKKSKKQSFWESTPVTSTFALAAFTGGILFLNRTITGNTIFSDNYTFNLISIIGLLLIMCGIILTVYTLKKK